MKSRLLLLILSGALFGGCGATEPPVDTSIPEPEPASVLKAEVEGLVETFNTEGPGALQSSVDSSIESLEEETDPKAKELVAKLQEIKTATTGEAVKAKLEEIKTLVGMQAEAGSGEPAPKEE